MKIQTTTCALLFVLLASARFAHAQAPNLVPVVEAKKANVPEQFQPTKVSQASASKTVHPNSLAVSESSENQSTFQPLAEAFTELIHDAIPLNYERKKDWGKKKRIPAGVKFTGHVFRKLRVRKRTIDVNHGVWKKYRITQVDPEKHLRVRVLNMHSDQPGHLGLTLTIESAIHGWAQAKVYNRGVHVIALTSECDTKILLTLDCDIRVKFEPALFLSAVVIDPKVTSSKLILKDFRLKSIGKLHGPLVKELGDGLKSLIKDQLSSKKLTKKLNRAIDKKREKLRFSADKYLASDWSTLSKSPGTKEILGKSVGGAGSLQQSQPKATRSTVVE